VLFRGIQNAYVFIFKQSFNLINIYLRDFKPVNNSNRLKKRIISNYISYRKFKRLSVGKPIKSGRNISGKIVTNHKGGGKYKNLSLIDFNRN
jgi:ribosomal protein L2